ncbi:hypothetical protein MIB92_10450 [Aestuariirhabdus sp. Z084]|uniref:hypothetical protein n=1 Tax=Aestuariirhabdus haliotis TaxID=2918751 RepID=UPI00201B3D3F|nr:hypothetical protein [Aestuariirhabdus haliotis]MCL6416074.1 hypothetical protein [Aestuariirhabdus haliotis]MCL6419358.1 hypothetical protein [Aestuariirhabdus haliotis]
MQVPLFIDYEASSLHEGSYPIEVGIVLADGSRRGWLIRPEPHWIDWDPVSATIHNIPRSLLQDEGDSVQDVAAELNRQLPRQTLYCDGLPYDAYWQQRLFDAAGFAAAFELRSVSTLLNEEQQRQWKHTKGEIVSQESVVLHRAENDAWLLQETWRRLCMG